MSNEKLVNLMNDGRLISASEHVIYPMLDLMVQQRLELACAKFRKGDTDFIGDIAFICGLKDIKASLEGKQLAGNKAYQKLHQET